MLMKRAIFCWLSSALLMTPCPPHTKCNDNFLKEEWKTKFRAGLTLVLPSTIPKRSRSLKPILFLVLRVRLYSCSSVTFSQWATDWKYLQKHGLHLEHIQTWCCVTKLLLGRHNTHVYSTQIENLWETKVHLGGPWVLLGSFTGIRVRGYLQEQKFLKRQLHHQSLPQHRWQTAQ